MTVYFEAATPGHWRTRDHGFHIFDMFAQVESHVNAFGMCPHIVICEPVSEKHRFSGFGKQIGR
jgi:hypothetical protein